MKCIMSIRGLMGIVLLLALGALPSCGEKAKDKGRCIIKKQ